MTQDATGQVSGFSINVEDIDVDTILQSDPNQLDAWERLRALHDSALLDTSPEDAFDRVVQMLSRTLGVSVGLVSLVTPKRQFFKSQTGLAKKWAQAGETPLSHSFCRHVVERGEPLVINDARLDPLVSENPAITEMGVIAYLGVPLRSPEGQVLGALCAIDKQPRIWSRDDLAILFDLSEMLTTELALRACLREKKRLNMSANADRLGHT